MVLFVASLGVASIARSAPGTRRDFNGDGRDDLLCMDPSVGNIAIDLTNASGQTDGTNSRSSTQFCMGIDQGTARLLFGDFNGDGRTDLLCHTDSAIRLDFADAAGQGKFLGVDWHRNTTWCTNPTQLVHVGDFNGDGIDDLLCHNFDTGSLSIDYADYNVRFQGTDWSRANAWCKDKTLHVGDFNGDGHDDLLCSERFGRIWIDYWAPGSTPFGGTDWTDVTGCPDDLNAGVMWDTYIADFNGDGRDDLRCKQINPGAQVLIDYADSAGRFTGANESYNAAGWCEWTNDRRGRERIGDYDGDGQDDLLCHWVNWVYVGQWVPAGGGEAIDYADNFGSFDAHADWSRSTDWCTGFNDRVF